jgi:hypothetical protein
MAIGERTPELAIGTRLGGPCLETPAADVDQLAAPRPGVDEPDAAIVVPERAGIDQPFARQDQHRRAPLARRIDGGRDDVPIAVAAPAPARAGSADQVIRWRQYPGRRRKSITATIKTTPSSRRE